MSLEKPKIIIIGAGMAGLAAANKLAAANVEVTILEARNRIGGRCYTDHSLGIPFDVGAAWIHGTENNPMVDLAQQFQARYQFCDITHKLFFTKDGHRVAVEQLEEFNQKFNSFLTEAGVAARQAAHDMPLSVALKPFLAKQNFSEHEQEILNWEYMHTEFFTGGAMDNLSARYWDQEDTLEGSNWIIMDGYQTIIQGLAKNCDVRLNSIVKQIDYHENSVSVITESNTFHADLVIVTLPLGVLKNNSVQFNPPLLADKQLAIDRLQMGLLNKVALKFPKVFWPPEYYVIYLSSLRKLSISAFANFSPIFNSPILVGFTGGESARALENFSDEELVADAMENLRHYFGNSIPEPEAHFITRWSQDPFTFGSYSYVPVDATVEDFAVLAAPVDNRLFFAGEATYPQYLGTTHGAYLSGIREAEKVLARLKV